MAPHRLPPLNSLRAFDVAARHCNFSRAAVELRVTQGAVSRHVAKLETELGSRLFRRRGRRLELTAEGARLHAFVRDAFERISEGVNLFARRTEELLLKIKVPPTLGIRWFVPRLVQFHALHPEIDVQITTSHQPVDFDQEDVDVAIHWGSGDWRGLSADFLIGEELTPVCSPEILIDKPLREPADLSEHVLLHSMNRTNDWRTWLEAAGVHGVDWTRALKFENSGLTYQAAIDRLGVVVAQCAFVVDDLATGRLVAPFPLVVPGERAYFLVLPLRRKHHHKVTAFRDWLLGTTPPVKSLSQPGRSPAR
jgi:LysR family glycine cleavage system transcriptional activator